MLSNDFKCMAPMHCAALYRIADPWGNAQAANYTAASSKERSRDTMARSGIRAL
jgi:hypothetical protein